MISTGFKITLQGFKLILKGFKTTLKGFKMILKGFKTTLKGFKLILKGFKTILKGFKMTLKGSKIVLSGVKTHAKKGSFRSDRPLGRFDLQLLTTLGCQTRNFRGTGGRLRNILVRSHLDLSIDDLECGLNSHDLARGAISIITPSGSTTFDDLTPCQNRTRTAAFPCRHQIRDGANERLTIGIVGVGNLVDSSAIKIVRVCCEVADCTQFTNVRHHVVMTGDIARIAICHGGAIIGDFIDNRCDFIIRVAVDNVICPSIWWEHRRQVMRLCQRVGVN